MSFLDVLRCRLDRLACGGRILLAVSGGADSVALLRGTVEVAEAGRVEPVVAHLDHGLREESADDAACVRALAGSLGLECHVERRDVAALAEERGTGLEETARDVRYEFLRATAEHTGCEAVALAHTADDQAETVLHHVLRGTGLAGLRGMPRERPLGDRWRIVRPLLDVTRAEVEAYLGEIGQDFREDGSNADERFTRNRLRSRLLPLLETEFNPNVRTALLRLAKQADDASAVVDELATAWLRCTVVAESDEKVTLDLSGDTLEVHDHVLRTAFVALWRRRGWRRQRMGFADWQRLVDVARAGGAVSLPGGVTGRRRSGAGTMTLGRENADVSG